MRSALNTVTFELREKFWGQWRARKKHPEISISEKEQGIYRALLTRSPLSSASKSFRRVWDIGCRNWSYIDAIAEAFPQSELIGVELDGNRRYWNLYRRRDFAEAWAARQKNARCIFGDFRSVKLEPVPGQAFLFFFPFVSENPTLAWGLPTRYADFGALLKHALELASPDSGDPSWILSAHQGEWEAEAAKSFYEEAGITDLHADCVEIAGFPYPIHIWTAQVSG